MRGREGRSVAVAGAVLALLLLARPTVGQERPVAAQEGPVSSLADPAVAQERPVLSLDDALTRATEFNPGYRRTVNNLGLSDIERKQAWAAYLPTFSVYAGTGVNLNRQLIAIDEFGNPVENPFTEWRTSSSTTQSINATLPVYQWGARSRNSDTQKAQARAREAAVTAESRGLRGEVVRAYRNAQNQGALLAVEESLLESRELDLRTTTRMFELAGATRVDVLTAELEVQRQVQRIQEASGQLQQALLSVRTVVGDPDLLDFQVDGVLPDPFDPTGLDPESLASLAYNSNPNLIEQEAAVDVSRAQAKSARRDFLPPLAISFSARQSTFGDDFDGFMAGLPDRSRSGGASIGINIPIFQGFNNKAGIVRAEIAQMNQEETFREAQLLVEEAVRARLIAVETAYQSYRITVRSQEISEERLRLGREQFRLGSRTFTELQQDIDANSQAERAVINQLFALERAVADLEEMVGEELR